jgi:hypothetical protein
MLEELVAWCQDIPELEATRQEARSGFFGEDDERPVDYWPGAGDLTSKERRFLGYFVFDWELSSGEHPVEVAVKRLYQGDPQAEALSAVRGARFVFAVTTGIVGRSVYLELENERFEVRNAQWAANLHRDLVVVAHLVPVRHGYWLAGPGWAELPFTLGPGIRGNLTDWQMDPVAFERMLQQRSRRPDDETRPEPPEDDDLDSAVARMSAWAEQRGLTGLLMSPDQWQSLVAKHMSGASIAAFFEDVLARVSEPPADEDSVVLNEMLGLLTNIWNNTPQPDRGGRTANQMAREHN